MVVVYDSELVFFLNSQLCYVNIVCYFRVAKSSCCGLSVQRVGFEAETRQHLRKDSPVKGLF